VPVPLAPHRERTAALRALVAALLARLDGPGLVVDTRLLPASTAPLVLELRSI
jgi:hypothetical protein